MPSAFPPRARALLAALAALCAGGAISPAAAAQDERCGDGRGGSAGLRVDNDLLGGQDEGYTNGAVLTLVSGNLAGFDDPCLPGVARGLNRALGWLQPGGGDQRNMSFTLAQAIFTPRDNERRDLITDDRPYAGLLVAGVGYHVRTGDWLESSVLRLGWVGPSARGQDVQRAVHKVTGSKRFRGWSNQLHDEPLFQLQREWARRWPAAGEGADGRRRWDAVTHWGASLGTLATQAVVGGQWRYGTLPDDFGSLPLWAGGDNTAPVRSPAVRQDGGWSGHLFAGADLRWVLRNITLDGNTFRDSHSVDKRALVGELSYGFVIHKGAWKFALARYHRTHEFVGQQRRPVFGSFTISRAL
ncbi:lipid A deacylase LpxR family protein [Aquincola sp. MAHUQ-54]|uniref:Lipid A deacylase LpxR family protein n=1 Tax=Aquincola agrisoli TaxID=3119538 RepID=A0AAW9Q6Z4_9BURK